MSAWLREAWESFRFTIGGVLDAELVGQWLAVMLVGFVVLVGIGLFFAALGAPL